MNSERISKNLLRSFGVVLFFALVSQFAFAIPTVWVTASDANASEPGFDTGTFRIIRDSNMAADFNTSLSVFYSILGSATNGVDYNYLSGVAIIPAGQAYTNIIVKPFDDNVNEPVETVILTLRDSNSYIVKNPRSATVYIHDNDLPIVTVSVLDSNASEPGNNIGVIRFNRTGYVGFSLTVYYNLFGGAINGVDYSHLNGFVSIPIGRSYVDLNLRPLDDLLCEGMESVIVRISSRPTYLLGAPSSGTVYIIDNDVNCTRVDYNQTLAVNSIS